jgi:hypothetical protein
MRIGPGHRVALFISSSGFPWFDRNMNTGNQLGAHAEPVSQPDHYHDPARPSRLETTPQRLTLQHTVTFDDSGAAFAGLASGGSRDVELRVSTADRSVAPPLPGRRPTGCSSAQVPTCSTWTSPGCVDTRVLSVVQGQTRLGETYAPGRAPLDLLTGS